MSSRRTLLLLAFIVGLTFLAHAPAMRAGFIWDDDDYVTENPLLLDVEGLGQIWTTARTPQYYPMVFTSFWVEHKLWGFNPAGYHTVNIALHALSAFLIGYLLSGLGVPGAWWVAVLFALHPVQVESVAWVTERKNVLSGLFYLLSFLSFLRFDRGGRRRLYFLSLALFVLALWSKTVTASLPVALALALLWDKKKLGRTDVARLVPYFLIGAGLALLTVRLEGDMVGIVQTDFGFSAWQRLGIASSALLFYPLKVLIPYPLIFNYPRWEVGSGSAWWSIAPLIVAGILVLLALAWRRGQRGLVLSLVFYGVTIFPALGFLDVYPFRYSFVADHFQYLAIIGTLIVLVQAGIAGGQTLTSRVGPAVAGVWRLLGAGLIVTLAVLTWQQSLVYYDLPTLWRDTIAKNPRSWLALNNLGLLYMNTGEYGKAIELIDRAIEVKPSSTESLTARGLTHYRSGDRDAALADFDRAIEQNPNYPQARLNRGELLLDLGRGDLAIEDLAGFVETNPDYLPARRSLARAQSLMGLYAEALEHLDHVARVSPDYEVFLNRGVAGMNVSQEEKATEDFGRALELRPNDSDALSNRAVAYVRLGRSVSALEDLDHAVSVAPDRPRLYVLRGGVHQTLGDALNACDDWARACMLGECTMLQQRCPGRTIP